MSVISERLFLPESIQRENSQQINLRKSWQDQEYRSLDGQSVFSPHNGWKKQTLDSFRQSLEDKKQIVKRYLDKPGIYKKLSCLVKRPSEFMLHRQTLQNSSTEQPIQQSVVSYDGGPIRHKQGSPIPNLPDERGQQIEPHVFTDQEVIEYEQKNDDRFQNLTKRQALRIAMKQKKNSPKHLSIVQKSKDKHSLLESGIIFVEPLANQQLLQSSALNTNESIGHTTQNEDLTQKPSPLKKFNFKFVDLKTHPSQQSKVNISSQGEKKFYDLSQKVTSINLMKKKTAFTTDELFYLKGAEKQPSFQSDEYLHEKLQLEIQAAKGKPQSYEENSQELERIAQRRQIINEQLADLQVKKTADHRILPLRAFHGVPRAKQEVEILGEIEKLRLRIEKIERNGLQTIHEDSLRFPDANQLKDLFQERSKTQSEALALKIANNSNTVIAQMEIQTAKKQFLEQLPISQVDKYVQDQLSHVKNTARSTNKIRDLTVIKLKQLLRINVEEELHREEQKQAVGNLIKKHDAFGIGFEEFQLMLQKDQKDFEKLTRELSEKVRQTDVFKKLQGAKILESNPNDPKFQFLRSCKEDLSICLPILDKIVNKKLALYGYTLSHAHCKALAKACKLLNDKLNGLVFDSCAISDVQLSQILSSISSINGFKSIVFRKNAFDTNSLEALRLLLNKSKPNQLTELKLIECRVAAKITSDLLQELQIKCHLEKLSLVHCNMTETSFKSLIDVIDYSSELRQLDISRCEVSSKNFQALFLKLSDNRTLTHLNLSWNDLFETRVEEDGILSKELLDSISNFNAFIKNNIYLLHLDIRQTGLTAQIVRLLVQAINESSSLLSMHLCDNPGLNRELILEIQAILGSKDPFVTENYIPSLGKASDGDFNSYTVQETLALKSILKNKKLQEVDLGIPRENKQKMIIERQISLSHLIPDSKVWRIITQEHRNCFVCDQHILGIVFWSKELFQKQTNPVNRLTSTYYEKKTQDLYDREGKEKNLPTLQASFTNWEPVPLLELSQLCMQINRVTEPNWLDYLQSREKIRQKVKCYADMNEKELRKVKKRILEFKQLQLQEWPRTLIDGILPHKKVQLVNGKILADAITMKQIDLLKQPVYCGVFFMRAGRQHFVVRQEGEAYVFKDIVKFREEEATL